MIMKKDEEKLREPIIEERERVYKRDVKDRIINLIGIIFIVVFLLGLILLGEKISHIYYGKYDGSSAVIPTLLGGMFLLWFFINLFDFLYKHFKK